MYSRANFQIQPASATAPLGANDHLGPFYWTHNGSFYPARMRGGTPPSDMGVTWWNEFFTRPSPVTDMSTAVLYPGLKSGLEPCWSFAGRVAWSARNSDGPDRPTALSGSKEAPY